MLLYICGEAPCDDGQIPDETLKRWATRLGANIAILEHRYYGDSQPFKRLTSENLRYLTVENALEDLSGFEDYARKDLGLAGKWIAIGVSYSGNLAAWYRLKHPNRVVGALASSAPVNLQLDCAVDDEYTAHELTLECRQAVQSVQADIDRALSDPAQLTELKKEFQATDVTDPLDFDFSVSDMVGTAVQYGLQAPFCQELLKSSDRVRNYAKAGLEVFKQRETTAFADSAGSAESTDAMNPDTSSSRSWWFQQCTQLGIFLVASSNRTMSVQSPRIDHSYFSGVCRRLFGKDAIASVDPMLARYYLPLLDSKTSNIFFTNGSDDPISALSISPANGNDTNRNLRFFTVQGGAHGADVRGGHSPDVERAQSLFEKYAQEWLGNPLGF